MTDHTRRDQTEPGAADFEAAERHRLEASLAATPSERLRWLEEALKFAAKVGALPKKEPLE